VCFVLSNVGFDGLSVKSVVLGDGSSQLSWVGKNLSPLADSSEVVTNVLAGLEGLWDLEHNNSEFEDCLKVVIPATLVELVEGKLDFWVQSFATGVASLNFEEVVFASHAVQETAKEVRD
jgi:hypothetical protein